MIRTLLLIVVTLFPVTATARDGSWRIGDNQIHLVYSDIDMRTPAGRAMMLTRVENAARRLCTQPLRVDQNACVTDALRQATGPRGGRPLAVALAESGGLASG